MDVIVKNVKPGAEVFLAGTEDEIKECSTQPHFHRCASGFSPSLVSMRGYRGKVVQATVGGNYLVLFRDRSAAVCPPCLLSLRPGRRRVAPGDRVWVGQKAEKLAKLKLLDGTPVDDEACTKAGAAGMVESVSLGEDAMVCFADGTVFSYPSACLGVCLAQKDTSVASARVRKMPALSVTAPSAGLPQIGERGGAVSAREHGIDRAPATASTFPVPSLPLSSTALSGDGAAATTSRRNSRRRTSLLSYRASSRMSTASGRGQADSSPFAVASISRHLGDREGLDVYISVAENDADSKPLAAFVRRMRKKLAAEGLVSFCPNMREGGEGKLTLSKEDNIDLLRSARVVLVMMTAEYEASAECRSDLFSAVVDRVPVMSVYITTALDLSPVVRRATKGPEWYATPKVDVNDKGYLYEAGLRAVVAGAKRVVTEVVEAGMA
mmetsp:Transcript_15345/g.38766  ORF Transcript_15345/g.38766 Transcript_15345/m.38766 type:complete len:438 (-) Transcript_15345:53-1366(-)